MALLRPQLAGQPIEVREAAGHEVSPDLDEVLRHQPLRTPDEQRRGIAGLMPLQVAADEVEDTHGLLAGTDLAADRRASTVRRLAGRVARRDSGTERRITDLEQALEGLRQRPEIDGP